ncbi:hypothetical protein [Scleromatobacter humisilvae]|uniref:YkuD domain-containing protein n=1 Tax=Scleromatobacter humisilvae TaxID=2897159 RepID=A0A9X1YKR3_9BURK|nr:hypothetical protein [Scleromatobacter humisilvae]MCK9688109.1 hypothetical protein [Scleromatobacter humisilvae]
MNFWGKLAVAASVAWISSTAFALTDPTTRQGESLSALQTVEASDDARYVEHWIHEKGDDHGRPFVIVDKKAARIFVFGAGGKLLGASSTLLGQSRGDIPVPGAGAKDPSRLLPDERKTPAGRFESVPGRNLHGEPVVWVDYDTGIAIHRVRPGISQEKRDASLATEDPNNKRLSLGCVVVPETFFWSVVLPTLGNVRGTVYVLPEDGPVQAMFAEPKPDTTVATRRVNVSAR